MEIDRIITDDNLLAFLYDQYEQTGNQNFRVIANGLQLSRREIDFLRWQLKRYEWISVKDRLPEYNTKCLVYIPEPFYYPKIIVAYYSSTKNIWIGAEGSIYYNHRPTHWMPLPSPPTDKEN